jgi:hypothetical protein
MSYCPPYSPGVRIGHWQEVEALKSRIGEFDPKDRRQQALTKARVIDHDERIEAKDYKSNVQASFVDPKNNPNPYGKSKVGPRQRSLDAQFKQQVDDQFAGYAREAEEKRNAREFRSTQEEAMSQSGFINRQPQIRESRFETKNMDFATETAITFYSHTLENADKVNFPITTVTNLRKPWSIATAASEGKDPKLLICECCSDSIYYN